MTTLQQVLEYFEGCKNTVYRDTRGLLTVGIGHLVISKDNLNEGDTVSGAQVDAWFQADVARSILLAKDIIGDHFDNLDQVRQDTIVSLAFNLGNRLSGFHYFIMAIQNDDFNTAGKELFNSLWYQQVGRRGPITVAAIVNGEWNLA